MDNAEQTRLTDCQKGKALWRKWGPYLSERQWGTVREDYSANGDAWNYFTHDQARSRAYRWGEDGIAGISDDQQLLCFALALWNGKDTILKERLFGFTNSEGNHGEDVKEYYFYLDNTPTHSYMRYLYKYPQNAYPYEQLLSVGRTRGRVNPEYELLDTGVFSQNRYFDVFIEYAKAAPEEILVRITICNRAEQTATIDVLPTLWFRNTWSWGGHGARKPMLHSSEDLNSIAAEHERLGAYALSCEQKLPILFVDNETNNRRLFGRPNSSQFVKDGINDFVVLGHKDAVDPAMIGTKAAFHWHSEIPAKGEAVLRLRLASQQSTTSFIGFDKAIERRKAEADTFYDAIMPPSFSKDQVALLRQSCAGMLWGKQYYIYDMNRWLNERNQAQRNSDWQHMDAADVISMPDKWEYPWCAAWDLAFHTIALGPIDLDFAKDQLALMLGERYLHPNGQIPAYEWNFTDVNPPVHAWATAFLHKLAVARGAPDLRWLQAQFNKLLLNFTWWVNRKDRDGRNLYEGGFLGLDNIGVFDRSAPLPTGGYIQQADGTAWMAVFCQHMIEIALELARSDTTYDDMIFMFVQHFLSIAQAMTTVGQNGMWDEDDGFFYDVLKLPDGRATRMKVRSVVGLLPLCAVAIFEPRKNVAFTEVVKRIRKYVAERPALSGFIHDIAGSGSGDRRLLAAVDESRLRRILKIMLDESEFLSPHGIRSLSRYHADHPYILQVGNQTYRVDYLPAESDSGMFGGNSNWRGPVWLPVNGIIIRALITYYLYYGERFKIECPTGSGREMNLFEVAQELTRRLSSIFLRDKDGHRPVYGGTKVFQEDPYWRDHIEFFEYFNGDNGAGLGASHQTGWTGVLAPLMVFFARTKAEDFLKGGQLSGFYRPPTVSTPATAAE